MTNLAMLVVCMLAGIILRTTGRVPTDAHLTLNAFIIHIALPAMIFAQIHGLPLSLGLLLPVSMPWVLFALSVPVFILVGRAFKFPGSVVGALIMTGGLANTSFVGLPMIETFFGVQDLNIGILIDQLGSYLVLGTVGISVASVYSSGAASWQALAKRVLGFPPFIALILALASSAYSFPMWLTGLFHRLADTLAPLALV
jgi:malate permease and related proteins